jgi:hypothetical protein
MIINDFNIRWPLRGPSKTNPELVIDANAPLTFPVSAQGLKPISRRYTHIIHALCQIKLNQFAQGLPLNSRPSSHMFQPKQLFCIGISERSDHGLY